MPYDQPVYLHSIKDKFNSYVRSDELIVQIKSGEETITEQHTSTDQPAYNPLLEEEKVMPPNAIIYSPDTEMMIMEQAQDHKDYSSKLNPTRHISSTTTKLNASNLALHLESQRPYQEDCDAVSSSRETEFSYSNNAPMFKLQQNANGFTTQKTNINESQIVVMGQSLITPIDQQNQKASKRRSIKRSHQNWARNLKEENDRAKTVHTKE